MKTLSRRLGAVAGAAAMVALAPIGTPLALADATGGPVPETPFTNGPMAPSPLIPDDPNSDRSRPPLDDGTFWLGDLGASDVIAFDTHRETTSTSISFVVPKGLTPSRLNATLEIPVELKVGYLSVTQEDRTVARIPLPTQDQSRVSIPLDGMVGIDNWAGVKLTITAIPQIDPYCWDPDAPIRLVDSSITFSGTQAAPTTVAAFLPPTLRQISIAVPRTLSPVEAEAALQLAAALTLRYGWQGTDIGVIPLPDGSLTLPPPARGERQIVIKEGPDAGLSLQSGAGVPSLLISGRGAELTNQTRLLTDASLPFAQSRKAVAGPLMTELKPAGDSVTLAQLKQKVPPKESLRPEVTINLDQTVFAQPVDHMRIHVIGSHTPLAHNFNGEVTASAGDQIIDRWPVNAEGTIDRWVEIPNRMTQRTTALKIRVHTTGDPGHCNDFLNPMLRIDDNTEITVQRASPPMPPGLRSLPQALMPSVQIGMSSDTFNDTVRAARIIVGLQRSSSLPLITTVTTLQKAIDSREPAILIAADDWTEPSLPLPISAELGKISIAAMDSQDQPTTLNLDPEMKFGSLQTVFDGQRSVLIATSTHDAPQLDALLRWLSLEKGRWVGLEGRAVISVEGTTPVTVPNRPSDIPGADAKSGHGIGDWLWWAAGGIAVTALAGALLILLRTHKATSAQPAIGGHEAGIDAETPPAGEVEKR